MEVRIEYVLDDAGWDDAYRRVAARGALTFVRDVVTTAETDIPWHQRHRWPAEVQSAAEFLRDRFVADSQRTDGYLQTGVQAVTDLATCEAFLTFAPFAYDSTFWADGSEVASVNDEGYLVVALTDSERAELEDALGQGRVVTLAAWRDRHPSGIRRLFRRLTGRG